MQLASDLFRGFRDFSSFADRRIDKLLSTEVQIDRTELAACGYLMYIYIRVSDDRIVDIKFQTFGCGSAVATSSMTTELVKGMTLDENEEYELFVDAVVILE